MPTPQIRALNGQLVTIVTASGAPVSMGRVRVTLAPPAAPRVELVFKTEKLNCTLLLDGDDVNTVFASFDGERYKYTLPSGDEIWLAHVSDRPAPPKEPDPAPPAPTAHVETYPLPPNSRLGGTAPSPKPPKPTDSGSGLRERRH